MVERELKQNQLAVRLKNVSVNYCLYPSRNARIKEALHPRRKKYHKEFHALNNINLEIRKGEILGVVGRNGSGKSTLLKVISGVLPPSFGSVNVKGALSAILELGSGFHPDYSGLENIYFYGSVLGFKRDFLENQIENIVSFADIGEFIKQPIKTYSSGMKARLTFAVNTAINPDILILDEVLAVGDDLFRRKCHARMEEFLKKGKTIIFVSHSVPSVNEMCTRAILVDYGEMILEGPAEFVTTNYHRLLYERKENVASLREELTKLNNNVSFKSKYSAKIKGDSSILKGPKVKSTQKIKEEKKSFINAELFTGMISQSKMIQKNIDVDIYDVNIKTLSGKNVNVLVTGESYIFSYKVKFNHSLKNVLFNYFMKTTRGVKLSGARYPQIDNLLSEITKGQECRFDWMFECKFLKGKYYCDIGVFYYVDEERKVATMIRDAILFEVRERKDYSANFEYRSIFEMGQKLTFTTSTNSVQS